jgi:hypothetical protein
MPHRNITMYVGGWNAQCRWLFWLWGAACTALCTTLSHMLTRLRVWLTDMLAGGFSGSGELNAPRYVIDEAGNLLYEYDSTYIENRCVGCRRGLLLFCGAVGYRGSPACWGTAVCCVLCA